MRVFLQGYLCIVTTTLILAVVFVDSYKREDSGTQLASMAPISIPLPAEEAEPVEVDCDTGEIMEVAEPVVEVASLEMTAPMELVESVPDSPVENPVEEEAPIGEEEITEVVEDEVEEKEEPKPDPAFELVLPTENREIFGDPSKFFMHTNRYIDGVNTKPWNGGNYGYVRNQLTTGIGVLYTRLHEGIDIRPLHRDSKGVPLDVVGAIAEGTVVYVNNSSSRSNYGKYIVVRHDWPDGPFYSLYAHMASSVVESGQELIAGQPIGKLGYTGAGIDRERAHVHLELAFMISENFATKFSPGNGHKNYNGLNLLGIDVARYFREYQLNPYLTMKEFLEGEEPYCKVKTSSRNKPGILERHPWLGRNMEFESEAKSWEFTFARTGVPLAISPCETEQKYATVSWVKNVNTNHSYMTAGRLLGSKDSAKLSTRGHSFIKLISEAY